jgi:hypothetical protein
MWKSSQDESFERDFPKLTKERYTLNTTLLTRAIKKPRNALLQIWEGKSPQAQSCHGFLLLQIEDIAVVENNVRIKPIPLKVAAPTQERWLEPSESTEKRCCNFWGVKAL